jgi:hypothetical protein
MSLSLNEADELTYIGRQFGVLGATWRLKKAIGPRSAPKPKPDALQSTMKGYRSWGATTLASW